MQASKLEIAAFRYYRHPSPALRRAFLAAPALGSVVKGVFLGESMKNQQHYTLPPSTRLPHCVDDFLILLFQSSLPILDFIGEGEGTVWVTVERSRAIYLSLSKP